MTLRPTTAPQRVPLPSPPASSLPASPDLSTAASALVTELVDFATACRLDYAASLVAESASLSVCPLSVGEVIEGPYSSQWQAAMDYEMNSWKSIGTYVDEVPPSGANIVSGMWIFRVKRPPGSPPVFKARYVAQGFSQRQGADFFQTFSPTMKMTTLRVLLHVAADRDYELHSLDFSTAFLQGSLHEEIWLRRPPGFTGSFPAGTQWSLRRPVYSLRQAPREWHDTLRTTLAALGFAPSTSDPSLFLHTDTTLPLFYVLVYVDDLVFATADTEALAHVKSELQKRHTCTDLGELTSYLGLWITRDRAQRTIMLTQSHMVQQVLQRFNFTYSSPHSTPLPTGHLLSAPPSDKSVEPSGPYPELVGCLTYLMSCTRPDLAYPLSLLARYMATGRHRKVHRDAAKRVLRYLCSTSGMGLVLGGRARVVLTGHADASWVDDLATQRSSQGYTFSLGSASVSWRSTRSSSVLSSSCEAEIYAGAMAAQELRWLTYLLTDLGENPCSPPVLYVDLKAMLALCQEHRLEHRTKHIALRYFLARELQQRGQLRLAYVASRANTADDFTKALPPCDHLRFCTVLGLVPTVPHLLTSFISSVHSDTYASAAAVDVPGAEDVGASSASSKRHSSKGKGGRRGGGSSGGSGGGSSGSGGGSRGGGSSGSGGGSGGGRAGDTQCGGSGGGQRQQQQRRSETPSPQQLREWFSQRGASGGSGSCPYVIRTGDRAGQTCGKPHLQHRCFSHLDDAWRAEFNDEAEHPCWAELLRSGVAIFDLDYDVILAAIYALYVSAEGDCYLCVPPDPGIAAAALGASESFLPRVAPAEALHTFTFDSGASRYFFREGTTLTPLPAPVPVRLADPSGGPVLARSSIFLPCPAHHRLGHPSLPRLCGMHSRLLVSGLPRSLPPLPPSPAPPCLPCVEGRQRAAAHSSSFPPMTAPLQTLHMDVWGPARVSGQGRVRYFLLVVDDYTRYTTVFPFRSKGQDLPVLCLHSDRGGEFSYDLLRDFCHGEGILQSFTLPDSCQQNGIAEHHIGLVMEVARTSMIHAAAPHFLWPFVVWYAAHQLNLWPRVSLPETSPTLRWTGKVGDASVFRFYHPTSHRVFPSQDVTFDESVPFYRLFPYCSAPPPPPPRYLAPGPPPVDPIPPQGPAPSGVSQVDPLPGTAPVEVPVGSGAARCAMSGGAASGGAEPGVAYSEVAGSGVAEPGGAEPGGAEPLGVERGGAEPEGPAGASSRLSSRPEPLCPQQLREWFAQCILLQSGASGAGDSANRDTEAGGAGVTAGAGGTGGAVVAGPGGARTRGIGAAGTGGVGGAGAGEPTESGAAGAGGAGAVGAGAGGISMGGRGAGGAGGTVRPRPYFLPLLQKPTSPLPAPYPYTEQAGGLKDRGEPASPPASRACTGRRVPRLRPPPVPGTHAMALRPSSVPLRVPLPPPLESSLPAVPDPESDRARAASPTVSLLLASVVTDPSFESTAASALIAELSASPPSVGGECALSTDVLQDRQEDFECLAAAVPRFASMLLAPEGDPDAPDIPTPRSYAEAIMGPYSSQWQAAIDAKMASWKSTGTYLDTVPPSRANIVDGMWIFRGVDYFQTFSPTPKMTSLWELLHVTSQRDYELHSLDFSTAFLQGSLHEEIWLRRPPGFTGTTLAALGFTPSTADLSLFLRTNMLLPPFYVLVYAANLVFATADTKALTLVKSELQKRDTCTDLGELRRSCSASASSSPPHSPLLCLPATRSQLHLRTSPTSGMGLVLGGRGPVVVTSHADASWVDDSATQRSSQGYTFSLGAGSVSWRSTRSSSQRGQLRLAYVATRANTADIFTKALPPACFAFLDWSCDHLFSSTLPMGAKMNHILRPLLDECVVVYLDDILIYSKNMKEHIEHLRKVFKIMRKNKFYVKLSRSDLALKKVQFLGHMVSAEGVHVDPWKIGAVNKWKVLENEKELQQFLGFANNYNRFVPQYA
ncbi:unnamed protein product [Closterium sp. NIES-53]